MAAAAANPLRRFLVPEAYPILFFTGSATALFCGFIGRTLVSDPDIMCTKARRSAGYLDPVKETNTANKHYNHFVRRSVQTELADVGIFPNAAIIQMTSSK